MGVIKNRRRMLCYTCTALAKRTEIHIKDEEVQIIYNRDTTYKFINDLIYDRILADDRINACSEDLRGVLVKEKGTKDMFSIRFYNKKKKMVASFVGKCR